LEAIDLIWNSLKDAVYNGEDIHPRARMMKGSYLAGLGLAMAGVGAVHAMAYPLGAFFDIPHGLANAVMLPYVMSYNLPGAIKGYGEISYITGSPTEDLKEAASELPSRIFELLEDIGLPTTLKELQIPKEMIPNMADMALTVSRPMANNPKPLSRDELVEIYETAYGE
jgi:alcohol dehydrogenase